jgi:hypothetical protein
VNGDALTHHRNNFDDEQAYEPSSCERVERYLCDPYLEEMQREKRESESDEQENAFGVAIEGRSLPRQRSHLQQEPEALHQGRP